jgi:uncharacterized protein YcbK (DUF882 family)
MDFETIEAWQECCDHFAKELGIDKVTFIINSAARCLEYNRKPVLEGGPGSTDGSFHPQARAIDGKIVGVSPANVYRYLDTKYQGKYGIGLYKTFVHLDTRTDGPARW